MRVNIGRNLEIFISRFFILKFEIWGNFNYTNSTKLRRVQQNRYGVICVLPFSKNKRRKK